MGDRTPRFNQSLGLASLSMIPPFELSGVVLRIFPLRARINQLDLFCRRFLNHAPEIVCFRPSAPFVYLLIVNYSRIEPELLNVGFAAQNEVAFSVPLEMGRMENGRFVFQDDASVSAYIFVDDATSQRTGREVYGWPKDRAWLGTSVDEWAVDPDGDRSLLQLRTMAIPEIYRSQGAKPSTLLEVDFNPPARWTRVPPAVTDRGVNPFIGFQQAMTRGLSLMSDAVDLATWLPSRGYPQRDLAELPSRLLKLMQNYNPFSGQTVFNTINLKQFRDAEEPETACFQAIVNSRMRVTRYNTLSLLGDEIFAGADSSAGFRVRFHRHKAWPIIETLGLEVEAEHQGEDVSVATLRPLMPYWVNMDMAYEKGERLSWRTKHGVWRDPAAETSGAAAAAAAGSSTQSGRSAKQSAAEPAAYNTARGASRGAAVGPFAFPEVTIRVLPLMADGETLASFCDDYLNDGRGDASHRFEAVGSYVYMLILNYQRVWSGNNELPNWPHRAVQFSIPVKWYAKNPDGKKEELISMGLLSPYRYADSNISTNTEREVYGSTTFDAAINSPPDRWMDDFGPVSRSRGLLSLDTTLLKAIGAGGEIKPRRLLDVVGADALAGNAEHQGRGVAERWDAELLRDRHEKQATREKHPEELECLRALALEMLVDRKGYNEISLKQFRDSEDPQDGACYQAAVRTQWIIERLWVMQEIEQRMHVKIYRYATQPIVESLGLKVKHEDTGEHGLTRTLQPIRPFWLRADLRTGAVDNLWEHSVGDGPREKPPAALKVKPYFSDASPAQARRAVETIEPQLAIESILSDGATAANRG